MQISKITFTIPVVVVFEDSISERVDAEDVVVVGKLNVVVDDDSIKKTTITLSWFNYQY